MRVMSLVRINEPYWINKIYKNIKLLDKAEWNNIKVVVVDRFYPSSKTCSHCGEIKKDLKLKDRIFECKCGFVIDRDINASINLMNYSKV
jgi:putative transposase